MNKSSRHARTTHPHIEAADGHLVRCNFLSSDSDTLVILSHGITDDKEEDGAFTDMAEQYLAPKFDSIRFDFRGHGESAIASVKVTIAGEILDFAAVIRWAQKKGYKRLFHVGASFGASITLLAISKLHSCHFEKVVFWNPVTSFINTFVEPQVAWGSTFLGRQFYENFPSIEAVQVPETDFMLSAELAAELLYYPLERISWASDVPLLIIHGDRDTYVPYEDSVRFTADNPSVKLKTLTGADHGFDDQMPKAIQMTNDWFEGKMDGETGRL